MPLIAEVCRAEGRHLQNDYNARFAYEKIVEQLESWWKCLNVSNGAPGD